MSTACLIADRAVRAITLCGSMVHVVISLYPFITEPEVVVASDRRDVVFDGLSVLEEVPCRELFDTPVVKAACFQQARLVF